MDVRRWVATAACVPLFVLAGCSDDEPQAHPQDPTTSAEPSPTGTATESAPTIPPEAHGTDEASGKAFVAYYLDVLNGSMASGETEPLSALGKPACVTCSAFIKNINEAYADGGYVKAEGWEPKRITRATKRQDMVFVVRVAQGRERFYSADGEVLRKFDGATRNLAFYLAKAQGNWLVSRLDLLA